MKKLCGLLLTVFLAFCLSGCAFYALLEDPVVASLPRYKDFESYSSGDFQDYTDYKKYFYESVDAEALSQSAYFSECTEEDVEELLEYIDFFSRSVEQVDDELKQNYDFDTSIISTGDYFYIETRDELEYQKFGGFNIYYFDIEAQILYFFHYNN